MFTAEKQAGDVVKASCLMESKKVYEIHHTVLQECRAKEKAPDSSPHFRKPPLKTPGYRRYAIENALAAPWRYTKANFSRPHHKPRSKFVSVLFEDLSNLKLFVSVHLFSSS